MHIVKVELEDIKSHAAAIFEFQRGTIAITGANGAGKTTIIEAIAWALFDLLEYKKEDFVRRGAKKGVVRVTFESGKDQNRYTVYRDTNNGFYIFDEKLQMRVAEKKTDVLSFLRQHLDIEHGTDVKQLFESAIGVPQGTFTADFLKTPEKRKEEFEKLLKVKEYRDGAEKLKKTADLVEKNLLPAVNVKLAKLEGELTRAAEVEAEFTQITAQLLELVAALTGLNAEIETRAALVGQLNLAETIFNETRDRKNRLEVNVENAVRQEAEKLAAKQAAESAAEKQKAVETEHLRHLEAQNNFQKLELERTRRDEILSEKRKVENALIEAKSDAKVLAEKLNRASEAKKEIVELQPQITEQERLEKEIERLRNEAAQAKAAIESLKASDKKLDELRTEFSANQKEINTTKEKVAEAVFVKDLSGREVALTQQLADIRASLARDEKFQLEVKNGLCPILSQKCLNLAEGETLETYFKGQFASNFSLVKDLEVEKSAVSAKLKTAREAEKYEIALKKLEAENGRIAERGKVLKEENANLKESAKNFAEFQTQLTENKTQLNQLNNPRERTRSLQREAEKEADFKRELENASQKVGKFESNLILINDRMLPFIALDVQLAEVRQSLEATRHAHQEFVRNEVLAKQLPEREREFESARENTANLKTALENASKEFVEASENYDAELHATEKVRLSEVREKFAGIAANEKSAREREMQLQQQLARFDEIRVARRDDLLEKERLERLSETTKFIRDTLKSAAPHIAKTYLYRISLLANQIYRDVTGDAQRTLAWEDDYEITLEEYGHKRPFRNLSGGEQMVAALSVRLALLQELSDIRIAFFDEPTTNLDAERRARLAEQIGTIGQIRNFHQLFVISHDDTFDAHVDQTIFVGKAGE